VILLARVQEMPIGPKILQISLNLKFCGYRFRPPKKTFCGTQVLRADGYNLSERLPMMLFIWKRQNLTFFADADQGPML
jgi:hypothetical protein